MLLAVYANINSELQLAQAAPQCFTFTSIIGDEERIWLAKLGQECMGGLNLYACGIQYYGGRPDYTASVYKSIVIYI